MRIARAVLLSTIVDSATPIPAQIATPPRDPNAALLVTSDIANFWHAYDRARSSADATTRARAYLDLYIRPGSAGLHDWVRSRLSSGYGLIDLLLAKGWPKDRLDQAATVPLSDAERARVTVRKAIVAAMARIAETDPQLGRHLRNRVRTGLRCRYETDPDHPVRWILR